MDTHANPVTAPANPAVAPANPPSPVAPSSSLPPPPVTFLSLLHSATTDEPWLSAVVEWARPHRYRHHALKMAKSMGRHLDEYAQMIRLIDGILEEFGATKEPGT